jgi:hypothetical protein
MNFAKGFGHDHQRSKARALLQVGQFTPTSDLIYQ